MLRSLRLLVLAIVTLLCAGLASPGPRVASMASLLEVAASDRAATSSHQWRDGGAPRSLDGHALEAELDDDDFDGDTDPPSDLAEARARASVGVLAPREPGQACRDEHRIDRSRFASGSGRPREPPA